MTHSQEFCCHLESQRSWSHKSVQSLCELQRRSYKVHNHHKYWYCTWLSISRRKLILKSLLQVNNIHTHSLSLSALLWRVTHCANSIDGPNKICVCNSSTSSLHRPHGLTATHNTHTHTHTHTHTLHHTPLTHSNTTLEPQQLLKG